MGIKHRSSDDYKSDKWILELFKGWFDPCPYKWIETQKTENGLTVKWPHRTFVNPPYSNPLPWVEYGVEQHKKRGIMIAYLLKHDSSTKWFKLLHEAGARFLLVSGRLKYQTGRPANFPSVIAILEAEK
tara:strand:- start:696 stop:1082 length:387 start_codon:yes stop_codon:yes gene_type:complete